MIDSRHISLESGKWYNITEMLGRWERLASPAVSHNICLECHEE